MSPVSPAKIIFSVVSRYAATVCSPTAGYGAGFLPVTANNRSAAANYLYQFATVPAVTGRYNQTTLLGAEMIVLTVTSTGRKYTTPAGRIVLSYELVCDNLPNHHYLAERTRNNGERSREFWINLADELYATISWCKPSDQNSQIQPSQDEGK